MRRACRACRVWHFRQLEISPGSLGSRLTFDFAVFYSNSFFCFAIDSCSVLVSPSGRNRQRVGRCGGVAIGAAALSRQTHDAPS